MVKKTQKYSTKTKSRMFIIFMFFSVIIFTLTYTLCINVTEIINLDKKMVKLEEESFYLVEEEARLSADIKRYQDPEYKARYVREKLLYSRDNELILRFNDK